ncbi:hypothetical protein [Aliivibrio fischeri]|uniref:hypothetical protein n=1 Tax=Aliivibrio fischeri TaxID=668 RepID=UPI0012DAF189|nr:hypothetical protein [Aliivibrio fischeri]MUJ26320.1 hypothetical protein [Aliivibrio fischeri]
MNTSTLRLASELREHSLNVTNALINLFMMEDHTCFAYYEVEEYLSKTLYSLADQGFFNSAIITIDGKKTPEMKFCKLSAVEQGILKEILTINLVKLGYEFKNVSQAHDQISLEISIS